MPKIRLSDAIGLEINGELAEGTKLLAIFPQFTRIKDIPLDEVFFDDVSAGLVFQRPIELPVDGLMVSVGASGGGRLAIIRPDRPALDDDDPFGGIEVGGAEAYLGVEVSFSVVAGGDVPTGPMLFGIQLERQFTVKCYRRFVRGPAGFPSFSKAFAETLASFVLPRTLDDLNALDPDVVLILGGTGVLSSFAGFSFLLPVQSLASIPLAGLSELQVTNTGSLDLSASVTLTTGYQVRLRRVAHRGLELGVYNLKSKQAEAGISAQIGLSAKTGKFDLIERFIRALSKKPLADIEEFRAALPGANSEAKDDRIASFERSLESAVSTKLRASVEVAFSNLRTNEAAWLFEIQVDAGPSVQAAITSALRGDFMALTRDPKALPAGITQLQNFLTLTEVSRQSLRVNLMGIVNFLSVTKISLVSTIERDGAGGVTLMVDTSGASLLQTLLLNVCGGDSKRLRRLLSETFFVEAAYRVANLEVLPPQFKARHTYLEIQNSTSRPEMKNNLDVPIVLGLIDRAEQRRRLGSRDEFGRTTFYSELRYTNEALRRAFLDESDEARAVDHYETLGRSVLNALLAGDDSQELRLRYARLSMAGDKLWKEMKRTGNVANFGPLFGFRKDTQDPRVHATGADFLAITGWAKAMNAAGSAIAEVEQIIAGSAGPEEARLTVARERLKQRLSDVVRRTDEHFGDPLGMMMVYLASGESAAKTVVISGSEIERLELISDGEARRAAHL